MRRQRRVSAFVRRNVGGAAALLFFAVAASAFAADELAAIPLKDQAEVYRDAHDYDGLYGYLSGLIAKGAGDAVVYFYRALARVEQVAHWKQIKNWAGVYDIAPTYQEGIAADLAAAEKAAGENATLRAAIAFLRWRAAQERQDKEAYAMFDDVVAAAEKAAASVEGLALIKENADEIRDLEDKNLSRRLYTVYLAHLAQSQMPDEAIRKAADGFVEEGNLYLAKSMYGIYLGRIKDDAVRAQAMVAIADRFAHPGDAEALDPVYAEEMYVKARELGGPAAFSQESLYRRAFNLERLKDHEAAVAAYQEWLAAYEAAHKESNEPRRAEVIFREAVLTAYGLADTDTAKTFFQEIINRFAGDPLVVSARYHLGLLAQWGEDFDVAKEHYGAALAKAKELGMREDSEIVALTKTRLEELEEEKPMAYGLRLFFKGRFGKEQEPMPLYVDLTGRLPEAAVDQDVRYAVTTSNPMTGCMTPDYAYEWSNEVGGLENIPNTAELTTDYEEPGPKVTFVAVLGTAGLEGVGFDLVQVK